MSDRKSLFKNVKRLVVKLGTRVITIGDNALDAGRIERIADDVAALRQRGIEVAIVTSGAIGAGMGRLGLSARPRAIPELQAAAAVGQSLLMNAYKLAFRRHDLAVGQILLTADDLRERARYVNARNTLEALFRFNAVPVINENDSVAVDELLDIRVGDNDTLSACVTHLIRADLLVLLSDVDGLYSGDPRRDGDARLIPVVDRITPELLAFAGGSGSDVGVGGMRTKLRAAETVTAAGGMMIIADGARVNLLDLLDGQETGTVFLPRPGRLTDRKRWIAFAPARKGAVTVDDGAARAIGQEGRSLLPSGIVEVRGTFDAGEIIDVQHRKETVARGLTRYSSDEVEKIRGLKSSQITPVLGRPGGDEVIHRDDMVVL
ncbi:MAG: glutamate 5-kinase [Candidatus Latescibacteria bacterium]|nr:glutamate 5-kinase [Candidatus Latescibacterota bacterium]